MSQPIEGVVRWGKSHGARLHDMVEIYDDPQYGISLRVKGRRSELTPGIPFYLTATSIIVSCPFELSLSYLNALDILPSFKAHSDRFSIAFLQSTSPHVIGNFFLIQQYLIGHLDSFWGPYIRSLPQPYEHDKLRTPLYFTDADIEWIKGTNLELAREQREKTWKEEWKHAVSVLSSNDETIVEEKWTWDLYKWAATIFSSRSFVSHLIPGEIIEPSMVDKNDETRSVRLFKENSAGNFENDPFPVLFPLVDLANHSSDARVTWFSNAHSEPKDLSIIVDSDIPQGNQIFNNYAPKGNTELLLGYGFCLPKNDEVAIEFTPFRNRLAALRNQQLAIRGGVEQHIFHVRRKPFTRSTDDTRLPEFAVFEEGFIDTIALYVANQHELSFMEQTPVYRLETEGSFAGPLTRNTLHSISVLIEKLHTTLSRILILGDHLGIPANPNQRAAKMYREGQIYTLQAAIDPLETRLDAALSRWDVSNREQHETFSRYTDMHVNVELLTLENAFEWLHRTTPSAWERTIESICTDLEVDCQPAIDWRELIENDWDATLWCLWIYIAAAEYLFGEAPKDSNHIMQWMKHTLQIYVDKPTEFDSPVFQYFHGSPDEIETLASMVDRMDFLNHLQFNPQLIAEKGGVSEVNNRLLNLASVIADQECLPMAVIMIKNESGKQATERVRQKVLCLLKRKHIIESSLPSLSVE